MSSVSLNKSIEQPVGPELEEQTVGPSAESQNIPSVMLNSFGKMPQKFFPITRKLMTGQWNGDLTQLSSAKKVLTAAVASFLVLLSSIITVPLVIFKNVKIKAFNMMSPTEQMNKTLLDNIDLVVNSAKAYQRSPDNHAKKLALEEMNRSLGETIDRVTQEFPEQAPRFERLIRTKIEEDLGSLLISIKPQSSQDLHRFTFPLARLVLDGFFPVVNGAPNPFMKGVRAESVTYQFEDGIFAVSKERLIKNFFTQSETNPWEALDELQNGLDKIQGPTKVAVKEIREAVRSQIAEKLNNPNSPEFQKFVEAARIKLDLDEMQEDTVLTKEQMDHLGASLVSSDLLTEGQGEVFLAQVKGDATAPSLFEVEAKTKQHGLKARKTAAVLGGLGAVVALEHAGYGPLTKLASYIPQDWKVKALELISKIPPKILAGIQTLGPKAALFASGALALYTIYHGYKSVTGQKMTKGQEAARSFASTIESRKVAIAKVSDVEFQAFEADVGEEICKPELESFKQSLLQADALVEQAGEALEAAGKNPTPRLIERAIEISEAANNQYNNVKKQADVLETAVQKASAEKKALPASYTDLAGRFKEAKGALKRIDNRLDGAQGISARGGKKIDELQRGLQKKVKKLAAFESIDLEQARTDVLRVEALEQEIQKVLDAKEANPKKEKTWEASLAILRQDLSCRKERIQEVNSKHERMKSEIVQLREMISRMGAAPSA